jgi:hypothetical protein
MACLAAKEDPLSYTILINTDPNWHQHTNPYHTEYPDTHVIAYIPPNTLQYHDPIKPIYDDDPHIKPQALQILYIHHMSTTIGNLASLQQLSTYTLIPTLLFQIARPTPPNTKLQYNKTWHILPDPPPTIHLTNPAPPFQNYTSRKRCLLQLTKELLYVWNYWYMTLAAKMIAPADVEDS